MAKTESSGVTIMKYSYKIQFFPETRSFLLEETNLKKNEKWIWTDMEINDMLKGKVNVFGPQSRESLKRMINWLKIDYPELTI